MINKTQQQPKDGKNKENQQHKQKKAPRAAAPQTQRKKTTILINILHLLKSSS